MTMTREEARKKLMEFVRMFESPSLEALAIEALSDPINCVKCEHYYETEEDWGVEGHCKMDTAHRMQGEWIPTSEKLPSECGKYIVTRKYFISLDDATFVDIICYGTPKIDRELEGMVWYRTDDQLRDIVYDHDDVIAWMPLPKTYKGDDE